MMAKKEEQLTFNKSDRLNTHGHIPQQKPNKQKRTHGCFLLFFFFLPQGQEIIALFFTT